MIIAKCKQCKRIFNTQKSWDRKYCSEDCYLMNMAGNQNAKGMRSHNVVCIGIFCRGHKKFKSAAHIHKHGLCRDCKAAIKNALNTL